VTEGELTPTGYASPGQARAHVAAPRFGTARDDRES
jgi:hypothetical protein